MTTQAHDAKGGSATARAVAWALIGALLCFLVVVDPLHIHPADEWNSIQKMVPSGDTVFQRVGRIETYRKQAQDVPPQQVEQAERMFELIDGRLSIERVI